MALIKCPECGATISDKAPRCPRCGYSAREEEQYPTQVAEDEPIVNVEGASKRKPWIIVAFALVFLLAAGGGVGWYYHNKTNKKAVTPVASNKNKEVNYKEIIVEITPELKQAVKKYARIGSFHDGLAPVYDEETGWGFVNSKGKEVIPCKYYDRSGERGIYSHRFSEGLVAVGLGYHGSYIYVNDKNKVVINQKFYGAGEFSEGIAAVVEKEPTETAMPLVFINKKGGKIAALCGKFYWDYSFIEEPDEQLPKFQDGVCEVATKQPNGELKRVWIDRNGNIVSKPAQAKPAEYVVFTEKEFSTEEYGLQDVWYPAKMGIKDSKGNVVVPAKYASLEEVSNGVALASLESYATSDANLLRIYGYVDMKGNETFTPEDYQKIADANEKVENGKEEYQQQLEAEQQRQYEEQQQESMRQRNNEKIDKLMVLEGKIKQQQSKVERAYRIYHNYYQNSGASIMTASAAMDLRREVDNKKRLYQQALKIAQQMEGEQGQDIADSYMEEIAKCEAFSKQISDFLNPTKGRRY